jgi:hypothetical protein
LEQVTITRREFSKGLLASLGLLFVQPFGDDKITIENVVFEDGWQEFLTLQPTDYPLGIKATLDFEKAFQYVTLIDDKGRRWRSPDGGMTWRSGLREFSLEIEE